MSQTKQKELNDQALERIKGRAGVRATYRYGRTFNDLEGKPTDDPKFRHRCKRCGSRRYEKDMVLTGFTDHNNYKDWMTWRCFPLCPI